jgi:predicted Rossmann fold nucleotide-binding protein DprA/Smf involved in DNA uptake
MTTTVTGQAPAPDPNRDVREVIREEPVMRARILAALADGPLTIPQIAAAIGAPTYEVVFWVMGMRRFGWLAEVKGSDADGYFCYEPTGRTS